MSQLRKTLVIIGLLGLVFGLTACGSTGEGAEGPQPDEGAAQPGPVQEERPIPAEPAPMEDETPPAPEEPAAPDPADVVYEVPDNDYEAVEVVAEPAAIEVLVNKKYALPKQYVPEDLVEPNVPFIFEEKLEKRKLRKEAAEALEVLFAAAEEDGILLAGVSGYRSYNTQKGLYNWYVNRDGREAADRYSARPGHSEHSTGLAMDISGIDGKCAATDCFGDTPEAAWLAENVYDYGFIIRYPEGKEHITGYKYEPWHLRFVGVEVSREIRELGLTLEEYTALRQAMAAITEGVYPDNAGLEQVDGSADGEREDGGMPDREPVRHLPEDEPVDTDKGGGPDEVEADGFDEADADVAGEPSKDAEGTVDHAAEDGMEEAADHAAEAYTEPLAEDGAESGAGDDAKADPDDGADGGAA